VVWVYTIGLVPRVFFTFWLKATLTYPINESKRNCLENLLLLSIITSGWRRIRRSTSPKTSEASSSSTYPRPQPDWIFWMTCPKTPVQISSSMRSHTLWQSSVVWPKFWWQLQRFVGSTFEWEGADANNRTNLRLHVS